MITYICLVTYVDPTSGTTLNNEASLTYTLITLGTQLKQATITGGTSFLYDADRNLVGTGMISLTAEVSSVSIEKWQYQNSMGMFVDFPTTHNVSINSATLNVYASETNIWIDDRTAIIKLVTSDASISDIHQIVKIYDGVAGGSNVICSLSNENIYVPADGEGNVLSFNGAYTELHIYEGNTDVTFDGDWNIKMTEGSGITGVYQNIHQPLSYTVTGLSQDTSYVDFVCTKSEAITDGTTLLLDDDVPISNVYTTITKRFTITKVRAGVDGTPATIYELEPDVLVLNQDEEGVFTPSSIGFSSYYKTGDQTTRSPYQGRFVISESTDGASYTAMYTSDVNESITSYAPSSSSVRSIQCVLYAAGSTTNVLDRQTIIVTKDGATGQDGVAAISMGLGNYQDVIPCTSEGLSASQKSLVIPFYAYQGIDRIPVTAVVGTLPSGVTVSSNSAGTTNADGSLILSVANGANFGNAATMSGQIIITLSCTIGEQTKTVGQRYTWTKSNQAVDGENAYFLQIYSEDGGIIRNSSGSTTLKIRLMSGASEVTPSSVQWSKFINGTYTNISGATNTSLVVTDAMVDDMAFFKATVMYIGSPFEAYYTVDDVQDPVMSVLFKSIPDFRNSEGCGAIYCRVYQNGVELDPIKSLMFQEDEPLDPARGELYYKLDPENKTIKLMEYNGSKWIESTQTDLYTYSYYRRDFSGNLLDTSTPYSVGRVLYVDPEIIGFDRMSFICEVTDS